MNFSVYFADNFEFAKDGKYLIHPPGTSDFVTKNVAPASLASKITLDLWYRSTGLNITTVKQKYNFNDPNSRKQFDNDVYTYIQSLSNGGTVDVNGSPWEVRQGMVEVWINPEDAKNDSDMYLANGLYMKVMVVNKQLVAIMAPTGADAMQDLKFRYEMLAPLEAVIDGGNPLSNKISWMDYQFYGSLTGAGGTANGQSITTQTIAFVP